MEKAESVDSTVTECQRNTSAVEENPNPDKAAYLPARIVVQNPAGDVTLGEDITRLKNEVADAQKRHEAQHAESLQPGGQRWAQVAYHQYWLSLCVTLQARKRLMLSPIGVDMGAMLWPVLSIILRQYGIQLGYEETLPVWALLSLSATCFLLDIATLLACSQDSQIVLVLVTVAHVPLYVSMFAANLNKNLWVLTRLLVFVCALRVLAVLREITWLETQYHEGVQVHVGWFSRLIVWSLSSTAKHNREQLLQATAEQQSAEDGSRNVDADMVSVYIGSHSMSPTIEISSNAASLSPEGSSTDGIAGPAPVLESAVQQLGGFGEFERRTTDGCCTHSSGGAQLGDGSNGAQSSTPSLGEGRVSEADIDGEEGNMRLGGAMCSGTEMSGSGHSNKDECIMVDVEIMTRMNRSGGGRGGAVCHISNTDACAESSQAAADARESGVGGRFGDTVVVGGAAEMAAGDSFLARDDSSGTMCTAESSMQSADDGFVVATPTSAELYGAGHWTLGRSSSEDDCAMS